MQTDLFIIGGGSAGLSAAIFAGHLGLDVTLAEQSPSQLGGECLRNGCVPSKALIDVTKTLQRARDAERYGLSVDGEPDWGAVKQRIVSSQEAIYEHESVDALAEHGVKTVFADVAFETPGSIRVGTTLFEPKNTILATGSSPRQPPIKGLDEANVYSNETVFSMEAIPDRLLVVGGGPLGCELGQAMNRLGSSVTIAESSSRLLGRSAPEASRHLRSALDDEGVRVLTDARVNRVSEKTAWLTTSEGTQEVRQDAVLLAAGREPNTEGLGLEAAGIDTDTNGYPVLDDYLQTTNDSVYAAGDLTGSYQLSHAAQHEATRIVKNLTYPTSTRINYDEMSWVTYTEPEVATFGKTRSKLDAEGIRYDTIPLRFDHVDRAIIDEDDAWGEIYVTGRTIRGGTVVADHAGSIIQELILAKHNDLKYTDFLDKIYPYPTTEEVNKVSFLQHFQAQLPSFLKSIATFSYRYL